RRRAPAPAGAVQRNPAGRPAGSVCVDYLPLKQDGIGPAGPEATRLGTVDLASGEYTACVDSGGDVLEAQWAPCGRQLAWVQRPGGRQRHGSELCCATAAVRTGASPPGCTRSAPWPGTRTDAGWHWRPQRRKATR